jgi:hypothetical protein
MDLTIAPSIAIQTTPNVTLFHVPLLPGHRGESPSSLNPIGYPSIILVIAVTAWEVLRGVHGLKERGSKRHKGAWVGAALGHWCWCKILRAWFKSCLFYFSYCHC